MRDPFPPARINGILALSATQSFFSIKETATRVMPALCHLTIDSEKLVRDQAFKALRGFMGKLEKVSDDPSLAEQMGTFSSGKLLSPNLTESSPHRGRSKRIWFRGDDNYWSHMGIVGCHLFDFKVLSFERYCTVTG